MIARRLAVLTVVAAAAVLAIAPSAGAHVEPTVEEVPAGGSAEVGFVPDHDCDGSPTVRVDIESPDSVSDPKAVEKEGWMSSVDGRVVTYEWEGVGGEDPNGFAVGFTVPNLPGETLLFPTIQTCAEGSIDWIQTESDGDRPAPRVKVIESDETPATTPDTTEPDSSETTDPESTEDATTTTEPEATSAPADGDTDGGSNTGLYVAVGAVVLAAGVGLTVYLRRRGQE